MLVKVTDVRIVLLRRPSNGHVAFVSFIIDGQIAVDGIALYTSPPSKSGYRLVWPAKKLPNGRMVEFLYPMSAEVGEEITQIIADEYEKLMNNWVRVELH
jgi:DNA-binding cell septation regulator SpoVG